MSIDEAQVLTADDAGIDAAVACLLTGGLVGLPTETVYGLAARAADSAAVARIFAAKGRPADHPLIVHIGDAAQVSDWAERVPDYATSLMKLWPGPLTLVVPKRADVDPLLTGGQATIALRMPAHSVALDVLQRLGDALAAPSANRFGQVSPTTAAHVLAGLGEHLLPGDLILDGGACHIGVESTIVDCTGSAPRILRPGAISAETVSAVAGVTVADDLGDAPRVSGSLPSHYAPQARVVLAEAGDELSSERFGLAANARVGVMCMRESQQPADWQQLLNARDADDYARGLYTALRTADELGLDAVVAVMPAPQDIGIAVRDRLMRAAAGR